jgi:hypothetical protein
MVFDVVMMASLTPAELASLEFGGLVAAITSAACLSAPLSNCPADITLKLPCS